MRSHTRFQRWCFVATVVILVASVIRVWIVVLGLS